MCRRIDEHNNSKLGAKYTKTRRPVTLVGIWSFENRSLASKEEYRIKKLPKGEKIKLINNMKKDEEKAAIYDQYLRESDALQKENSKLKSENPINISDENQKKINANNLKIEGLVKKLEDLLRGV